MTLSVGLGLALVALAASLLPDSPQATPSPASIARADPNVIGPATSRPERQRDSGPRRMYYRQGIDLTTRLEPADREVVVVQDCCPPDEAAIEGLSRFDLLTRTSDAVVLLRVVKLAARMTPERDWIDATVTADIEHVYKTVGRTLVNGERVVFEFEEGTVLLGGTRIAARRTWAVPLEEGAAYLAFLERDTAGRFQPLAPSHTFVALGGSYRPLIVQSDFSIAVDTASKEILRSAILPSIDFGARR